MGINNCSNYDLPSNVLIEYDTVLINNDSTALTNNDSTVNVLIENERTETELRSNIIKSGERWLGVRELTGKNDHPMIEKSMELCGLCGTCGYPWCASSHSEIFANANYSTIKSARVVDWFKSNIIWERDENIPLPKQYLKPAQSLGFYYEKLNRYGHITLLVYASDKRTYCYEGNTSSKGQFDPTTFEMVDNNEDTERDGDGFYPKTHSYYEIDVISDKCLVGDDFNNRYGKYLQSK